jgi:cobalt/nickel transport system permease protein
MSVRGFIPRTNGYTLHTFGNFVGTLLIRSFERTERVYKAMLSKGYQGEFHTLVTFKTDFNDWLKFGFIIILALALISIDISGGFIPAEHGWY